MALRSRPRSHFSLATSGPGRAPASDGRAHHRPPTRYRARHRAAPAEDLRRRAELLFGEHAVHRREPDDGPPGTEENGEADGLRPGNASATRPDRLRMENRLRPGNAPVASEERQSGDAPVPSGWRQRAGLAVRERLPVWLQARCGLERRAVVALAVPLVIAAAFAAQHFWTGRTQPVSAPRVVRAAEPYGEDGAGPGRQSGQGEEGEGGEGRPGDARSGTTTRIGPAATGIVVDVSGKVREPGIRNLPAGSRVTDALRAAGGVRPGTGTEGLNRARFLVDGEQIIVGGPQPAPASGTGGSVPGAAAASAPVSLSTATTDQLDALPGVGPVLAQHIVDYRTRHGGFRTVDELRQVNGIGARRFADLRNLVLP